MPANRDQLLPWQSAVHFNGFSASGQIEVAELIRYMITMLQQRQPEQTHLKLLQMSGDVRPNPGPATKYPCPVCTRIVTSQGVSYKCTRCSGWVHAKCSGILNSAQYRRKSDWTCDTGSAPPSQQSLPPTLTPALPIEQISPELHHGAYTLHGQGGGLLIFIHRLIIFSKQPSSPESLSDPLLEELSIKAELGNTKLIISNVYIPPASSCSNGYQYSIEHPLTTPDTLILGDFNAHHPLWYSRSTDTRGRKWPTQSTDLTMVFSTGTAPQEFRQMQNRIRPMSH